MSSQPLLLDVPKDSLTAKEALEQFKQAWGIWTYGATGDWEAVLLKYVPDGTHPIDHMAKMGFWMQEVGYAICGKTEREAVFNLCKANDIPMIL